MLELSTVQQIAVWILPVLFAITLHEAAHAWVAYMLGDVTARQAGRVSINPMRHIDPVGTVVVPIVVMLLSHFSFVFGWAKPVMINSSHFKKPRRDIALSVAAGPTANVLMAVLWACALKIGLMLHPESSSAALFLILTARAGIIINLLLAIFNLLPVPPLDGSKIVAMLLPAQQAMLFQKLEPYGFFILLALMFTGVLNWLISPPINWSLGVISRLFGL
ncbi:site-2 protease family protein [Legionella sp. CNM-4043-24]|uniref:site-2 protease family protein n=1 Tax=Legionella sp. CNM-4043-24 TaxID=3421646 RepID=UPI00403B09FA